MKVKNVREQSISFTQKTSCYKKYDIFSDILATFACFCDGVKPCVERGNELSSTAFYCSSSMLFLVWHCAIWKERNILFILLPMTK